jgi:hypothetical protein
LDRSFKILADVELTPASAGVIVAQGSRFGGYSLFVKDAKLYYVYNFLGVPPEQQLIADLPAPGRHLIGVEFTKVSVGQHKEPHGPCKLYVDDNVVAEAEIRTIYTRYGLPGEGLCVGYDSGDSVSKEYRPRSSSPGARSTRSFTTSPATTISTSRTTPPPWPATRRRRKHRKGTENHNHVRSDGFLRHRKGLLGSRVHITTTSVSRPRTLTRRSRIPGPNE